MGSSCAVAPQLHRHALSADPDGLSLASKLDVDCLAGSSSKAVGQRLTCSEYICELHIDRHWAQVCHSRLGGIKMKCHFRILPWNPLRGPIQPLLDATALVNPLLCSRSSRSSSTATTRGNSARIQDGQSKVSGASSSPTVPPPLSVMPTRLLFRQAMITSLLSSPRLVGACLPVMDYLSRSELWVTNPDRNPILKALIKMLFYNNFAAGENSGQVKNTVATLKSMGCHGVVLGYAKETMSGESGSATATTDVSPISQIGQWKIGNLQTVELVGENDIVAVKYVQRGYPSLLTVSSAHILSGLLVPGMPSFRLFLLERLRPLNLHLLWKRSLLPQ